MENFTTTARCGIILLLIAAITGITTGIAMIVKSGYSRGAVIVLTSGGYLLVLIFVVLSFLKILGHGNSTQEQAGAFSPDLLPREDFPPKYRLTWREEYMEKNPTHTRDFRVSLEGHPDVPSAEVSDEGHTSIWTTRLQAGEHNLSRPIPQVSLPNDSVSLSPKPKPDIVKNVDWFDEGLPSYAEALSWK